MRLWRWLCCRTGHYRETVEEVSHWIPDYSMPLPGCFIRRVSLVARCLDCGDDRVLMQGAVPSQSRRYALRRTP